MKRKTQLSGYTPQELIDTETVAKMLNVSENMVRRMCLEKKIPSYKIGRLWRIPKHDILTWISLQK